MPRHPSKKPGRFSRSITYYRSRSTGRMVSKSYATRYPHLAQKSQRLQSRLTGRMISPAQKGKSRTDQLKLEKMFHLIGRAGSGEHPQRRATEKQIVARKKMLRQIAVMSPGRFREYVMELPKDSSRLAQFLRDKMEESDEEEGEEEEWEE